MENATKALIIAGSVLVAILVIAFGMRIFRDGSQPVQVQGQTMETTAIATFNSQFAGYNGDTISRSKLNNFLQKIIAANASLPTARKIKINGATLPESYTLPSTYTKATINISSTCYNTDGYIISINVTGTI